MKPLRTSGAPEAAAICSATMSSPSISYLPPQPLNLKPAATPRRWRLDEDRAGVAQPDVAELAADDLDRGVGEQGLGGGLGLVADHHQAHALAARTGQGAGQVGDLLLRLFQVFPPQFGVAGEAHPHGAVRSPFGGDGHGHSKAQ
jgi:hypothetical protein